MFGLVSLKPIPVRFRLNGAWDLKVHLWISLFTTSNNSREPFSVSCPDEQFVRRGLPSGANQSRLDLSFLSYQGTYPSPADGWFASMHKIDRNGLEQPFHPRRVHCLLFIIPDGLGSDRKDRGWRQNRGQPPLVQEPESCRKVVCEKVS